MVPGSATQPQNLVPTKEASPIPEQPLPSNIDLPGSVTPANSMLGETDYTKNHPLTPEDPDNVVDGPSDEGQESGTVTEGGR